MKEQLLHQIESSSWCALLCTNELSSETVTYVYIYNFECHLVWHTKQQCLRPPEVVNFLPNREIS